MLRRSFLFRFAGMLGGLVGLGVEGVMADISVPCPDCGKPALPRRRYKNATEYACTQCGRELPLGAFIFTLKDNDPRCYAFFPLDIEKMFRSDIPYRPLWPESASPRPLFFRNQGGTTLGLKQRVSRGGTTK